MVARKRKALSIRIKTSSNSGGQSSGSYFPAFRRSGLLAFVINYSGVTSLGPTQTTLIHLGAHVFFFSHAVKVVVIRIASA